MAIELISVQAGKVMAFGAEIEDPVAAEAAFLAAQIVTLACSITEASDNNRDKEVTDGRERIRTLCRRFDALSRETEPKPSARPYVLDDITPLLGIRYGVPM